MQNRKWNKFVSNNICKKAIFLSDLSKKYFLCFDIEHYPVCKLNISLIDATDGMQKIVCNIQLAVEISLNLSLGLRWTCYKEIKTLLFCLKQECFHYEFCQWFWGKLLSNLIDLCCRIFFIYSWVLDLTNVTCNNFYFEIILISFV